ncbi:hypothetical protein BDA99DRAFT_486842 [Phascolomyces articulosus]|uniref:Uncharacterized protein n=1 Tax=Phascolomyces articulosus TaxID=60185 RepID=A0AAD5K3B0_9FUNG|nr:hypothetical protein BDA99DRAFT_486842 [Phascolomyces articulosus]
MEAIDDFANENIARSLAYTVLEHRQQHQFSALAAIGSTLLCQRIRFLGPPVQGPGGIEDPEKWNNVVQWQEDNCPQVIETLWSGDQQDKLYQNPVYYKRLDAETLHCMVEFAYENKTHYAVVLALEEGGGDISELKYHNTKAFSKLEWQLVKKSWPESLEQAEREFVTKISHPPSTAAALSSPSPEGKSHTREAPDDYWGGGWSSSEDEGEDDDGLLEIRSRNSDKKRSEVHSEKDDSEDEYFSRFSQNPGTLTPGINEQPPPEEKPLGQHNQNGTSVTSGNNARMLQPYTVFQDLDPQQKYKEIEKLEMQEEYDNSYNPLYTVPSVPDLMDAHHTALAELTQMLHETLPGGQKKGGLASSANVSVDPIPKIVRSRQENGNHVPGAFPNCVTNGEESITTTAATTARATIELTTEQPHSYGHDAGQLLLEKSLRALVGVGKMLGFKGSEILDIAEKIVKEETSS